MLFCIGLYTYSENLIDGTWLPGDGYPFFIHSNSKSEFIQKKEYSWGKGKSIPNTTMEIDVSNKFLFDATLCGFSINSVKSISNTDYQVGISRYNENVDNLWELELIFHFIDENSFWIENVWLETNWVNFCGKERIWYRISGPARITPKQALINDTRVRIRTKPSLQSDTWGFLNTGDKVILVDKSETKLKIAGHENYWYKVDADGYPDGWVFGQFIDQ